MQAAVTEAAKMWQNDKNNCVHDKYDHIMMTTLEGHYSDSDLNDNVNGGLNDGLNDNVKITLPTVHTRKISPDIYKLGSGIISVDKKYQYFTDKRGYSYKLCRNGRFMPAPESWKILTVKFVFGSNEYIVYNKMYVYYTLTKKLYEGKHIPGADVGKFIHTGLRYIGTKTNIVKYETGKVKHYKYYVLESTDKYALVYDSSLYLEPKLMSSYKILKIRKYRKPAIVKTYEVVNPKDGSIPPIQSYIVDQYHKYVRSSKLSELSKYCIYCRKHINIRGYAQDCGCANFCYDCGIKYGDDHGNKVVLYVHKEKGYSMAKSLRELIP